MENIEAFINYCDLEFAQESVIGDAASNVWKSIRSSFSKISKWCSSVTSNINYFKDAELDENMNKDLESVLKMSQPRTELNFKVINLYYKALRFFKKDNGKVNRFAVGEIYENFTFEEDFDELVKRSSIDTKKAIDATKSSKEYKRLQDNKYSNEKKTKIPLNTIQQDISSCNNMMNSMNKELNKMEFESTKSKNANVKRLINKMHIFMKTIVSYCTFRIGVLGRYLRYAKLSIKDKFKGNKQTESIKSKSDLKYHIPKIAKKIFSGNFEEMEKLVSTMKSTDDYSEYKKAYDEFTQKMGISGDVIKSITMEKITKTVIVSHVRDDGESINVSTYNLYHASDNPNLTQLNPFFRSKSGTTFFPTPRIYFHLNVPANRLGSSVQLSEKKGDSVVYQLNQKVNTAYVDRELGKSAVYVNTDKPLKIKKIDYTKWKQMEEIKLGFDKVDKE